MLGAQSNDTLINVLKATKPISFNGVVWRVVLDGKNPLICSAFGGRWDDGSFQVLYTSMDEDGARKEVGFHLRHGQPVEPSKVKCRMYKLELELKRVLQFSDLNALNSIGIKTGEFGQLSYEQKNSEYPITQEIAKVAHSVGFNGLIVPSARSNANNVIVFCDKVQSLSKSRPEDCGIVNWDT